MEDQDELVRFPLDETCYFLRHRLELGAAHQDSIRNGAKKG